MDNSPSTVRIFVGAGCSFEIPRKFYEEALVMATLSRKVWFVGLGEGDRVEVGPDRQALMDSGCHAVAWIVPASKSMAMGV